MYTDGWEYDSTSSCTDLFRWYLTSELELRQHIDTWYSNTTHKTALPANDVHISFFVLIHAHANYTKKQEANSLYCIYLIDQARGPHWENIGPRSWQYRPSAAWSVQKRPRADILPVRSRASLVYKRFITRLKINWRFFRNRGTTRDHSGQYSDWQSEQFYRSILAYWPSDCLSRVIKTNTRLINIVLLYCVVYYNQSYAEYLSADEIMFVSASQSWRFEQLGGFT